MVFLIIGVFVIIFSLSDISKYNQVKKVSFCILGVFLCLVGIFCPVSGYEKTVVLEEHVLEKILPSENKYIIQTKDDIVKYVIKEKNNGQEEKKLMHTNSNVEVLVVDKGIIPIIRKYSVKPRKSVFTFAMLPEKIEYKIFLNENDIKYEKN